MRRSTQDIQSPIDAPPPCYRNASCFAERALAILRAHWHLAMPYPAPPALAEHAIMIGPNDGDVTIGASDGKRRLPTRLLTARVIQLHLQR